MTSIYIPYISQGRVSVLSINKFLAGSTFMA